MLPLGGKPFTPSLLSSVNRSSNPIPVPVNRNVENQSSVSGKTTNQELRPRPRVGLEAGVGANAGVKMKEDAMINSKDKEKNKEKDKEKNKMKIKTRYGSSINSKLPNESIQEYSVMNKFYYTEQKYRELLAIQTETGEEPANMRHSIQQCSADFSCGENYACDVNTGRCLSTDKIPFQTVNTLKLSGKKLTGSGRNIVRHLLENENYTLDDIITSTKRIEERKSLNENHIRLSDQARDYIKKNFYSILDFNMQKYPLLTRVVNKHNIDIKVDWPAGIKLITDFVNKGDENIRLMYMLSKILGENKSMRYASRDEFPPILNCIANILVESSILQKFPTRINMIKIERGGGMKFGNNLSKLETCILSTGGNMIMNVEDKYKDQDKDKDKDEEKRVDNKEAQSNYKIPLLGGSVLSIDPTKFTHGVEQGNNIITNIPKVDIDVYDCFDREYKWERRDSILAIFHVE